MDLNVDDVRVERKRAKVKEDVCVKMKIEEERQNKKNNHMQIKKEIIENNENSANEKFKKILHPIEDDEGVNVSDLIFYYDHLYPFNLIFRWLTYKNDPLAPLSYLNDPNFFAKREISFTCSNNSDEIYLRWQGFKTAKQLKEKILSIRPPPHKFDIGAVYTQPISQKESSSCNTFKPQQKELVLDVDMNDYDDVRSCCKGKKICKKCWLFLAVAMRLLDAAFRDDFGCKQILWVYSGRRGIHCWVCDSSIQTLESDGRSAIIDYLTVISGSEYQKTKVQLKGKEQHPHIERSFEICMNYFSMILQYQDFFNSESRHIQNVLHYLPDTSSKEEMSQNKKSADDVKAKVELWIKKKKNFTSHEFFNELCELGNMNRIDGGKVKLEKVCTIPSEEKKRIFLNTAVWLKRIVLAYSYPRLDVNVSKDMSHLLKAPFCIHQGTGRVCIPINIQKADNFDPMCVPTLSHLRCEFDDSSTECDDIEGRTSLGYYTWFFRTKFLENCLKMTSLKNKEILQNYSKAVDW